ncbi:MAG: hypothetical protein KAS72_12210 [Phycisphaerales bacterium]|nr:hypothetical protein [Phycisphaerales bacterium]
MVRHITTIAICLVMGLTTSVLVAWGLAILLPPLSSNDAWEDLTRQQAEFAWGDDDVGFDGIIDHYYGDVGRQPGRMISVVSACGPPFDESFSYTIGVIEVPHRPSHSVWTEETGWPFHCLMGQRHRVHKGPRINSFWLEDAMATSSLSWVPAKWRRPSDFIPLRPLWVGLVADSVCYGLLFFLAFLGGKHGRRFARRKRGRCPLCAYDLRGELDAGCPECGWNRGHAWSVERSAARRG